MKQLWESKQNIFSLLALGNQQNRFHAENRRRPKHLIDF